MPSAWTFPPAPEINTVKKPPVSLYHDHLAGLDHGPGHHPTNGSTDATGTRFRKASSIAYHRSGLRETRERPNHGNHKSFVVIVPPVTVTREHGQLGHILSTGPSHRLSQGIILPLFSTLYGQLTAIAREFNFPSTIGLCLYLQYTENGITTTPRISDESWQLLWGCSPDGAISSSERRSPIAGRVEFDINFQQARWYATWISSRHREPRDQPAYHIPSTAQSLTHYPGGSRTTLADFRTSEEFADDQAPLQQPSAPITRHIPKKLTLVERFDVLSARSDLKATRSALPPPDELPNSSRVLSPIFQQEEPRSAMHDLNTRVKSWRASALLTKGPLAVSGQTSLEPEGLPNNISIPKPSTPAHAELDLEDYSWSMTSAGPGYCASGTSDSSSRVPSVHIIGRLEGSVSLTPSACNSFGPPDYISSSLLSLHLPSPDLAHRMYEDAPPPTASTATSWGPPSSNSLLHEADSPIPSLDLGERSLFSRPISPSTGTRWGPSSPWPIAPLSDVVTPSVHLGDRGEFSHPISPVTATSWGAPSYPPSPVTPYCIHTPDAGHRGFEDAEDYEKSTWKIRPWQHVWPYTHNPLRAIPSMDRLHPWPHMWPYIQRGTRNRFEHSDHLETREISPPRTAVHQKNDIHRYPDFNLSPTANLSVPVTHFSRQAFMASQTSTTYPAFELYPAVYPYHLDQIYPIVSLGEYESEGPTVKFENHCNRVVRYPIFNLYPPVYPYFDLYPGLKGLSDCESIAEINPGLLSLSKFYQTMNYPVFDLYPTAYPNFNLYPAVLENNTNFFAENRPSQYPGFNLYPAVYPHIEPCPVACSYRHSYSVVSSLKETEVDPTSPAPKNPVSASYPLICPRSDQPENIGSGSSLVHLTSCGSVLYPVFDIYPAVYPYFNLYPTISRTDIFEVMSPLNPGTYPHFDLYPAVSPKKDTRKFGNTLQVQPEVSRYPFFNLYPAVYPHFELYPPILKLSDRSLASVRKMKCVSRLTHSELHALVMMETALTGLFSLIDVNPLTLSHKSWQKTELSNFD